jgi:hypothetical protein
MDYEEALRWLGVDPSASQDEIRAAYVRSVREHRPDSDPQGFQRTREAYELLSGDHTRAVRGRADAGAIPSPVPVAPSTRPPVAAIAPSTRPPVAATTAARVTDAPLRRIEACLGLPIDTELVQAVVDWFEAARREPDPEVDLEPLALDVALRLLAAGRTDEARRIAMYLTAPTEVRDTEDETTRRLELRRRALAELLRLEGRIPPGLLRAYAALPATGGDLEALRRELRRLDAETLKKVGQEVALLAPLVDAASAALISPQRRAATTRAPARVVPKPDATVRVIMGVVAFLLGLLVHFWRSHQ